MSTNIKKITNELHKAFHLFNKSFYNNELPEPSILVQNKGNRTNVLGWCTVNKVWADYSTKERRYEISIVSEYLHRGMLPILATLLHEMVHLHNLVNNIQDVSRNGTYHNKEFKNIAEKGGLMIEHDKRLGWSITRLQESTVNLIKNSDLQENVFTLYRLDPSQSQQCDNDDDGDDGAEPLDPKPKSSRRKYVCPVCNTIISATKEVSVFCGICGVEFELEE